MSTIDRIIVTGFRALLPTFVAVHETSEDPPDAILLPDEQVHLAHALEKRRREFTTVRHCARQAMGVLGVAPASVPPGPRREPLWPGDIVGSMTHCLGYRAAAVARRHTTRTIGIDSETNQNLPDGVHDMVMNPVERRTATALTTHDPRTAWDRLFFSAKEAVYKAWYPLTHLWLDFNQCAITLGPGVFRALVTSPEAPSTAITHFHGRWGVTGDHLLTAIHVPETPREGNDAIR